VVNYLQNPVHQDYIEQLKAYGLQFAVVEEEIVLASESLSGKTFLISGVFADYSREELAKLIESHGGKMVSSISAKLNYLVAGDKMGPAKLAKAEKLNIPIIDEHALLQLIQN